MAEKSLLAIQQENLELIKENLGLKETVTKLLEELNRRDGLVVQPEFQNLDVPDEEAIIENQIKRLNAASRERVLSLEEIRALDLLIKNKKLIVPEKPIEPEYTEVSDAMSADDLLRIAGNVKSNETTVAVEKPAKRSKKSPVA